jgi:hypothetical protein
MRGDKAAPVSGLVKTPRLGLLLSVEEVRGRSKQVFARRQRCA